MTRAVSSATSKFPHSMARSKRVFLSSTKWRAIYEKSIQHSMRDRRGATCLWESFLLQVSNYTLTEKVRCPDNVQHLLVVIAKQGELEAIFRRIDRYGPRTCRPVQAMYGLALDASEVHGIVERTNNTMIPIPYTMSATGERSRAVLTPVRDST